MGKINRILVTACLLGLSQTSLALDAQQLAGRCASCHGISGVSSNPAYPNLAGQKAPYLLKQIRDFQSGKRSDPVMNAMVKGLTESEMDALANYYSNKK
ncbi:MAG: cytochrome c [Thioalkalispiraceae bacterium]|jgi:cytochrome c553